MSNVTQLKKIVSSPTATKYRSAKDWWEYQWTVAQNFTKLIWMRTDEVYEENNPEVDWNDVKTINVAAWNIYAMLNALSWLPKWDSEFYEKSLAELGGDAGQLVIRCLRDPETGRIFFYDNEGETK